MSKRTTMAAEPQTSRKRSDSRTCVHRVGVFLAALLATGPLLAAGQQPGQAPAARVPSASQHRPTHPNQPPSIAQAAPVQPADPILVPEPPKPPAWPANDQPSQANVVWDSQGLRVDASNSSLRQILKDVSTATGSTVDGLNTDQRIFGTYGPGPARDVISQLLDGSGYNVVMVGDMGQGTPRRILLSSQPKGPAPPVAHNPADDNADTADEQPQPQPPPPQPPPAIRNGFNEGMPPRTPQQIMQEMQQRQQQIEQMQQQQLQQNNPPR